MDNTDPPQCVNRNGEQQRLLRGCKPTGEHALSNAERQARYRARQHAETTTAVTRLRRLTDRRSRPQWLRDAVDMLLALQADYAD